MEPAFTVFEVPFWNRRRMKMKGRRRISYVRGGERGKKIVSVDVWLRKWNGKHLFVSKIYVLAAQNLPSKVQPIQDSVRVCAWEREKKRGRERALSINRNTEININTSASHTGLFLLSVHCYLILCGLHLWVTHHSDCLTQGQNFEVKTCLLVCWIFIKSCLSACRRSTGNNNLGAF